MTAFLDIRRGDGCGEEHRIDGRVIIGRGGGAQIALPDADELEPEHLLVHPQERGCWVSVVQGARTPAWVGGSPFEKGYLEWGSELCIGGVVLRVRLDPGDSQPRKAAVSLPMMIAIAMAVPTMMWLLSGPEERRVASMTSAEPPQLLSTVATCPDTESAAVAGHEARLRADAKRVRYPFDPNDGVEAHRLYGVARDCFERAGLSVEAQRAAVVGKRLLTRIDEDYRTRRLSLERMIKSKHHRQALQEARVLLGLLDGRKDPYTRWLRALEQKLSLRGDV